MKVISTVYANQSLKFGDSTIEFKNGAAEISDELFTEIKTSGFPNIHTEGTKPVVKSKASADFDKTLQEVNTEYMAEIDRLKKVNNARAQEVKELQQQLENLKLAYDKDIKELQGKLTGSASTPVKEETPSETPKPNGSVETEEEEEVRKDLESMKLPELQKIAEDQGLSADNLKKLTKKELIDSIMGKNE